MVTKIYRNCGTNNLPPSVQIIVQFFIQFCAQAPCTVKLSVYVSLRIEQFFTQFCAQAPCTVKLSVQGPSNSIMTFVLDIVTSKVDVTTSAHAIAAKVGTKTKFWVGAHNVGY